MNFNDYQRLAMRTAAYKDDEVQLQCALLGLSGEVGEVHEIFKKSYRKGEIVEDLDGVALEIGDIMWYIASLATVLGLSLEGIAQANLSKLRERMQTGELHDHV